MSGLPSCPVFRVRDQPILDIADAVYQLVNRAGILPALIFILDTLNGFFEVANIRLQPAYPDTAEEPKTAQQYLINLVRGHCGSLP
jgi:hypothetical protein